VPNGRQRGGFNPDRLADLTRAVSIVPQIVNAPTESPARGFTEVKTGLHGPYDTRGRPFFRRSLSSMYRMARARGGRQSRLRP